MTAVRHPTILTTAILLGLLGGMTVLTSYSVTLYRLFCQATGAGGTTGRAATAPGAVGGQPITVGFDTSVAGGLLWSFAPVERQVVVRPGVDTLVFFSAENHGKTALAGHATFNVTPEKAAAYFKKIQCFCFTEERLDPGARVEMPVDFFVDPRIATDPATADVRDITLSYTFFPSRRPDEATDLARFDRAPPDAGRGAQLFAEDCAVCHAPDHAKVGPPLAGVVGRRAGIAPGYAYSVALRNSGVTWTTALLDRWLAGPQALVPGSQMPVRIDDPARRRDIVAYLATLHGPVAAR